MKNDNEKYSLIVEPFQVAHDYPKPTGYTSDIVWLSSPNKNSKMPWSNGDWKIYLFLKSERGVDNFEAYFEL